MTPGDTLLIPAGWTRTPPEKKDGVAPPPPPISRPLQQALLVALHKVGLSGFKRLRARGRLTYGAANTGLGHPCPQMGPTDLFDND